MGRQSTGGRREVRGRGRVSSCFCGEVKRREMEQGSVAP